MTVPLARIESSSKVLQKVKEITRNKKNMNGISGNVYIKNAETIEGRRRRTTEGKKVNKKAFTL